SLDYEEPDVTAPRFAPGFWSNSISSPSYEEYEGFEPQDNHRPLSAGGTNPGRRRRRHRESSEAVDTLELFQYPTVADGHLFRLCVLYPGTGPDPIECGLLFEHSQ